MSQQNERPWVYVPGYWAPARWVPGHWRRAPQQPDPSRQRLIEALRRRFNLC
ncbi:MAG: hypothetical protein OXM01_11565 [Gemmatimonadota bacterium]|nr:hypothetical protein [Gemmatimonadota bacterium]